MKLSTFHLVQRWVSVIALLTLQLAAAQPLPANASCSPAPTNGDDTITCDGANDTLNALDGNDQADGGAGNDTLNGGNGNDTLMGGAGTDSFTGGAGNDTLVGGLGNDTYNFDIDSALGTDTVTEAAGEGTDTITFSGSTTGVFLDLGVAGAQSVHANLTIDLTNPQVENATGGNGNDTLTGNDLSNALNGGTGNDTLHGLSGNDSLTGAAGNDALLGGSADDTYNFDIDSALGTDTITEAAGEGTDTITFSGSTGGVALDLGVAGVQTVHPNLAIDLTALQVENAIGGNGNDTLTGNDLSNTLNGGSGNDVLSGRDGDDSLDGGSGNDSLYGEAGTDSLIGGSGNDTLIGGTEADSLDGGTGNDSLFGEAGADTLTGGTGNDVLSGGDGDDSLTGGDGDDSLTGGAGDDSLSGDLGNDTLTTDDGIDDIDGGAGDDSLIITGLHVAGDRASGGSGVNTFSFQLGTSGALEAVSTGEDTLDFSLFGAPIHIDMGHSGQQDVGGGLLLTLTGLFRNIIGTLFDDILTGNAADNALNGLAGQDILDGGAGQDLLDGGPGTDTVANYDALDTHTGIELGFPPAPQAAANDNDEAEFSPTALFVHAQDGLNPLSCLSPITRLLLFSGDYVEFAGLCGYEAEAKNEALDSLPPGLAGNGDSWTAVSVTLFHQGSRVPVLPGATTLTLSFRVPQTMQGQSFLILYWDASAKDGAGEWLELPGDSGDSSKPEAVMLRPDAADDSRQVVQGVRSTTAGRVEVTVNFTGTFVVSTVQDDASH
jgi:Ca2+-binding RTX toxin-like protein